ncbi:hypothetical protein, partial [Marinithermofilum abyssi]|uniref:hypothetical protein n=1 Tax=Marinithermofilum abyssi TaxID=1571185 RepID=UPI001E41D106
NELTGHVLTALQFSRNACVKRCSLPFSVFRSLAATRSILSLSGDLVNTFFQLFSWPPQRRAFSAVRVSDKK